MGSTCKLQAHSHPIPIIISDPGFHNFFLTATEEARLKI